MNEHIEITSGVCGGRPRIRGRRIRVQDVVQMHLHWGHPIDAIARDYELAPADLYAALAYYFDHREEIDRIMSDDEAFIESMKKSDPSVIGGHDENPLLR